MIRSKHLVAGLSLALAIAMTGCQPKEEKPATTGEATPSAEAPATTGEATPAAAAEAPTTQAAAGGADLKNGELVFKNTCAVCHQAEGQGVPNTFPPIAGSEQANGPADEHIKIVLKGLSGPITVKGQQYNGVMPPQAQLSDKDIADVVSFERTSWGNKGGEVTADQVKALR